MNYPRCPYCDDEFEYLEYRKALVVRGTLDIVAPSSGEERDVRYYENRGIYPEEIEEFKCPWCEKTLFDNFDDAKAFLLGEKNYEYRREKIQWESF